MKQSMNKMLLAAVAIALVSCSAVPEKSSSTPTQKAASPKVQAEANAQEQRNPSPSPGAAVQPGKLYYTVDGATVTIHNTPAHWGVMQFEMTFPTGATGGRASLYIPDVKGDTGEDAIDVVYTREGVKSVTMKGVPIPRKLK
jgi:hypothetical protein